MIKKIVVVPNQVILITNFIQPPLADDYFRILKEQVAWQQDRLQLFGKSVLSPRLSAWYGDAGAYYAYSGIVNAPHSWLDPLMELKDKVSECTNHSFNSALLNLYRDGNDSMGAHSDNEKELGVQPMIASVSLGATRNFVLQPIKSRNTAERITIPLISGSLVVMSGECQQQWKHSVPKTKRSVAARINITYRKIKKLSKVNNQLC